MGYLWVLQGTDQEASNPPGTLLQLQSHQGKNFYVESNCKSCALKKKGGGLEWPGLAGLGLGLQGEGQSMVGAQEAG